MNEEREYFVYRMYDEHDHLLYVGCTKRPKKRWSEHRNMRPHMIERVHRVRMVGPLTRRVARDIEYFAIRSEDPEFGWTPKKAAVSASRNAWINQRIAELHAAGIEIYSAIRQAVDEVDLVHPNPAANEYPTESKKNGRQLNHQLTATT